MDVSLSRRSLGKTTNDSKTRKTKSFLYVYVNEHGEPRGPTYGYNPNDFENWRCLRYFLETGGHLFVNDSTYLVPYGIALADTDVVPHDLKIRRMVMPLGTRQYVPPEQNTSYLRAKAEYDDLKHNMDSENATIMTQEIVDYTDAPRLHEAMYNTPEMQDRLSSFAQKMRTIETKCGSHASTIQTRHLTHVHDKYKTSHTTSHAVPPETYMCLDCRAKGDHFRAACSFVNATLTTERDVTMKFGAAKMKKIVQ